MRAMHISTGHSQLQARLQGTANAHAAYGMQSSKAAAAERNANAAYDVQSTSGRSGVRNANANANAHTANDI
jgi:hypothetical protein